MRNRLPLGPYRRALPRTLWWSYGGGAFSYERGTPVTCRQVYSNPVTRDVCNHQIQTGSCLNQAWSNLMRPCEESKQALFDFLASRSSSSFGSPRRAPTGLVSRIFSRMDRVMQQMRKVQIHLHLLNTVISAEHTHAWHSAGCVGLRAARGRSRSRARSLSLPHSHSFSLCGGRRLQDPCTFLGFSRWVSRDHRIPSPCS
jgi:hypothetical protein